jgi:uncharacterized protein YcfL
MMRKIALVALATATVALGACSHHETENVSANVTDLNSSAPAADTTATDNSLSGDNLSDASNASAGDAANLSNG